MKEVHKAEYRKTAQTLLPRQYAGTSAGEYDIYPAYSVSAGKIAQGFDHLASQLIGHSMIVMDGYVGVLWDHFQAQLDRALQNQGVRPAWVSVAQRFRPVEEIQSFVEPFVSSFDADAVLVTGGIAKAWEYFASSLSPTVSVPVEKGVLDRQAALIGAAALYS